MILQNNIVSYIHLILASRKFKEVWLEQEAMMKQTPQPILNELSNSLHFH